MGQNGREDAQTSAGFFDPYQNCWRVRQADRLALVVDGEDYFAALRQIVSQAQHELLLIGWDFDFEIEMLPGESDGDGNAPDGLPNHVGAFLQAAVDQSPNLNLYILKWNGAVVVAPGRLLSSAAVYVFSHERIHFALDGHHPFGACHHQKIIVADNSFAFCGGIDVTENRWDTAQHLPGDTRRVGKDGALLGPWHDATTALAGPVAESLGELARARWFRATGETLTPPGDVAHDIWPESLAIDATQIDVAIARTEPPYDGSPLINEIECLFLDSIRMARDTIYIESQYFTTQTICDALYDRLSEDHPPEVIIVNPEAALSGFEDQSMHVLRGRAIDRLQVADHSGRFRIYSPVNSADEPIYVHAKIMIVDDTVLHIGSSNLDDRSMGFDTECDVAIHGHSELISSFREKLLSEHLGVSRLLLRETLGREGSVIATIERLNALKGRSLKPIQLLPETWVGKVLADTRLMDPRYVARESSNAGKGLRPRHIAVAAAGIAAGYLAVKLWKRWNRK
ncbi:phospholipase D-like domain-containing protein [Loktanella salsilacus]|uniref:phospholipase D-like domain-containing protein n=1 Tax=Loktanella salsilacus TaxID=195913 RepID=UPI003703EA08